MIESRLATDIAAAHGLDLADARALALMADSADEACDLAHRFAAATDCSVCGVKATGLSVGTERAVAHPHRRRR